MEVARVHEAGPAGGTANGSICVVIPAFNEAGSIAHTIAECRRVFECMGRPDSVVVVVDDGSSDQTAELARQHGAVVVRHPANAGYGRSLKDGILASPHDTIVISDADGTYPIDRVPDLLAEYARGFDMVVGARTGEHYRESWYKSPLRAILRHLVEFTVGRRIPDVNSGLRVFSKSTVLPYFNRLCDVFSFTTSLTLAYMMTGRFISYMPIAYHQRVGRSKVRLFRDSLRTLQYITQSILYYNPIKLFLVFCGLIAVFGGLCLAVCAVLRLSAGFYLGIGSLLSILIMFGLGLIAEMMRQIMLTQDSQSGKDHS